MSRFHRYSVNNTMLIYMQKPDATLVAGYNKWKDQFERHVKKGEHGIDVYKRQTINRAAHKSTRYYIDEMHLLLKEEQTAAYTVEIWKRFRKWGGIPTGDWVCNLLAA